MDIFNELLEKFANSKKEFYLQFWDRLGLGYKVHLPVPVLTEKNDYCLKALIHYMEPMYCLQPRQIMQVCSDKGEYFDLDESVNSLKNWKGPLLDMEFWLLDERLLLISGEVFACYHLRVRNLVVEEYAQGFRKITPPEFMRYYEQISPDFMKWIK
jgi:hypothetical protein